MTVMLLQNNVCVYNNNNNNNVSKNGPATIENQYREQIFKNEIEIPSENRPRLNVFSLSRTGDSKRKGKAMNYYRLWIYACNAVLLVSVLGFIVVAGKVVLVDPRRSLIPGLTLHEPSLLYAYLALLTQSGLLQLLGCIGAHKLNEKLLNMYWFLLLFLLFGDAFIGIVWIFRFDKMYTDLRPILRQRLQAEYGVDGEFTQLWDNIQRDFRCCGVEGPQDFNEIDLGKDKSDRKSEKQNSHSYKYEDAAAENDRNRVIIDKAVNQSVRDNIRATMSKDNLMVGAKSIDKNRNLFLSTLSFDSNEPYGNDPNTKYVKNVPESCCKLLKDEVPDESKEEIHEEQQSKPTAIRQRLEKKKNRHQETRVFKRSPTTAMPQTTCKGVKSCKSARDTVKGHVLGSQLEFHANHFRHESLYRNTHHYSTSLNTGLPNATQESKTKEFKYAKGNLDIMDTCANVNGHVIGTIYGMSETLHFSVGCEVKLKKWLRDSAHVLGVLGYCVIAFLKLCFLGILRYEIREMIQKIKLLQGELQPPILLLSTDSPTNNPDLNSPTTPHNLCNHVDNSAQVNKTKTSLANDTLGSNPDRIRANSLGNAFLLLQSHESGQTTPAHQKKTIQMTQQNNRLFNSILGGDGGNESDTNSHCALLIDGDGSPPKKKHSRVSSNGNNNYESHELQDLLLRHSAQI